MLYTAERADFDDAGIGYEVLYLYATGTPMDDRCRPEGLDPRDLMDFDEEGRAIVDAVPFVSGERWPSRSIRRSRSAPTRSSSAMVRCGLRPVSLQAWTSRSPCRRRPHGPEISRGIPRQLVMSVQRPGGQAQFSAQLAAQRPERAPLRDILGWMAAHPDCDLGMPALAARAVMRERNFTRVLRAKTGHGPAAHVESARIEAARRLLEAASAALESVANGCGFGTVETLRRSFKRTLQVTPREYRKLFSAHTTTV
ncbi:helix-turn-helix domain-containing protein [Streptomyces europaeiscabiei]|uniref:helix-turn-helix domain-containing protein n=1 Tax=Streptomyces europaeiscabiei TaxID=146819 RepID=UPI002E195CC4